MPQMLHGVMTKLLKFKNVDCSYCFYALQNVRKHNYAGKCGCAYGSILDLTRALLLKWSCPSSLCFDLSSAVLGCTKQAPFRWIKTRRVAPVPLQKLWAFSSWGQTANSLHKTLHPQKVRSVSTKLAPTFSLQICTSVNSLMQTQPIWHLHGSGSSDIQVITNLFDFTEVWIRHLMPSLL